MILQNNHRAAGWRCFVEQDIFRIHAGVPARGDQFRAAAAAVLASVNRQIEITPQRDEEDSDLVSA